MIISVWKPYSKTTNNKKVFTHYELVENSVIYKTGTTGYKVIWKCDNIECKYKDKQHSISRCHLDKNRSEFCYEELQICHACQFTGDRNPRSGDSRSWIDIMGKENADKMKKIYSENFIKKNPSKLADVKIKKGQFIVNTESVRDLLIKENFTLIYINGDNKKAILDILCPNKHIYTTKFEQWQRGRRCIRCYYDSLKIDIEDVKKFEQYSRKVRLLTAVTYRSNKTLIDPDNKKSKQFHLDHIYSVADGFKNNIDAEIIASVKNLRIVEASYNLNKGMKSEMTIDELFN